MCPYRWSVHPLVHRRKWTGFWEVKNILECREGETGTEYLIEWEPDGDHEWDNSWEPEEGLNEAAVQEYHTRAEVLGARSINGLEVAPLIGYVREQLAGVLKALKHGSLASYHTIPLDCVALAPLTRAFFELVARPAALPQIGSKTSTRDRTAVPALPIERLDDGSMQISYVKMTDIAKFTSLEETSIGKHNAKGALIHNLGRDFNVDVQSVALPLVFSATPNPKVKGTFKVTMKTNTVFFNGAYGTPRFPRTLKGAIKQQSKRDDVVAYVRKVLPRSHPLHGKGWTKLPIPQYELPDATAVPDGEDGEDE